MTPLAFPQLPPAEPGYEYAVRVIDQQTYMTTGLFPVDAPDHTLPRLYRAGCLVLDVDLVDWFVHVGRLTKAEAKAKVNALSSDEVQHHLDADLAPTLAEAWAVVLPDVPGPTALVQSGCGLHVYLWLPDDEGYGDDIPVVRSVNHELGRRFNLVAGYPLIGLGTTDAGTRILRPPGTVHTKNSARPLEVKFRGAVRPETRVSVRALVERWGLTATGHPAKTMDSSPQNPALAGLLNPPPGMPVLSDDLLDMLFASREPVLRRMVEEDPLFRWAVAHPEKVGREPWRALATNLVALSDGRHDEARALFHEVSAFDKDRYRVEETDRFFDEAVKSYATYGPITYEHLGQTEPEGFLDEVLGAGVRPGPGAAPSGEAVRRENVRNKSVVFGLPVAAPASSAPPGAGTPLPANPAEVRVYGPYFRGDEVELGIDLADRLGRDRTVFDRGQIRRYNEKTGGWALMDRDILKRMAHVYAGKPVKTKDRNGEETSRAIKASDNFVTGIAKVACRELFQPGFFDAAPSGVLFKNGFLKLDGILVPCPPEFRVLAEHALEFDYDPIGEPSALLEYIESVFRGDDDAAQKGALFQEFLGACLFGIAPEHQKALILVGEGEAGKSTILFVVEELFPKESVTSVAPQDFGREYNKYRLMHSRINVVSEMPENEIIESTSVKAVITGDNVEARQIRQEVVRFRPRAGHLFATNNLPPSNDRTEAFFRRFVFITFNNFFVVPGKVDIAARRYPRDLTLLDRMKAERSRIAAWAVVGAMRLKAQGRYTEPTSHAMKMDEWREMSDSVLVFSRDCIQKDPTGKLTTTSKALYEAYDAWCKNNGHKALSSTKFAPRLQALGFVRERKPAGMVWDVYFCEQGVTVDSTTPFPPLAPAKTAREIAEDPN